MTGNPRNNNLDKYKTAVILKDGSTLHLRPILRDDEERMLALFYRMSPHTSYLRFHQVLNHMTKEEVRRFCTVDYDNTFALVATLGEDVEEKVIAVGRYARLPRIDAAELALVVEDAYQGRGIGTLLLEQDIAGRNDVADEDRDVPEAVQFEGPANSRIEDLLA